MVMGEFTNKRLPDIVAITGTAIILVPPSVSGKLADDMLSIMADPATDLAFNKIEGSIPLRTDINVDGLSPYQQAAAKDLRNGKFLLSMTHGELISPDMQAGLYQAVSRFVKNRDPSVFGEAMRNAVNTDSIITP
jgi:glucose/mannose transport system substrate-binding protein